MKRLLSGLIMLVCSAGSTSYAQGQDNQTDASAVKDTISKVHAAISSLDIAKMEPIWFHNTYVMLVNPRDKSVSVGWDDVKELEKRIKLLVADKGDPDCGTLCPS
jgi:hypothetical protein